MGSTDFRGGYGFNSGIYGGQRTGGLLGLLQEFLEQEQPQPGVGFGSPPNWNDNYFSPQGGLPGQLFALPTQQSPHPPYVRSNESTAAGSRNPDFRQVSRAPIVGAQQGIGPNIPADYLGQMDALIPQSPVSGIGASAPVDPVQTIPQSRGAFDADSDASGLPWISTAPATQPEMDDIEAGRNRRYRGPPIPKGVSLLKWFEEQETKKASGQFDGGSGGGRGNGGNGSGRVGGGGSDDENECEKQLREESAKCYENKDEYYRKYFLNGCIERAKILYNLCYNEMRGSPTLGEGPREWEPGDPEWRPGDKRRRGDDEAWFNPHR